MFFFFMVLNVPTLSRYTDRSSYTIRIVKTDLNSPQRLKILGIVLPLFKYSLINLVKKNFNDRGFHVISIYFSEILSHKISEIQLQKY